MLVCVVACSCRPAAPGKPVPSDSVADDRPELFANACLHRGPLSNDVAERCLCDGGDSRPSCEDDALERYGAQPGEIQVGVTTQPEVVVSGGAVTFRVALRNVSAHAVLLDVPQRPGDLWLTVRDTDKDIINWLGETDECPGEASGTFQVYQPAPMVLQPDDEISAEVTWQARRPRWGAPGAVSAPNGETPGAGEPDAAQPVPCPKLYAPLEPGQYEAILYTGLLPRWLDVHKLSFEVR